MAVVKYIFKMDKKPGHAKRLSHDEYRVRSQMEKDLFITRWQKAAVKATIKATLIHKKLKKILGDEKLTSKDRTELLQEALADETIKAILECRQDKPAK